MSNLNTPNEGSKNQIYSCLVLGIAYYASFFLVALELTIYIFLFFQVLEFLCSFSALKFFFFCLFFFVLLNYSPRTAPVTSHILLSLIQTLLLRWVWDGVGCGHTPVMWFLSLTIDNLVGPKLGIWMRDGGREGGEGGRRGDPKAFCCYLLTSPSLTLYLERETLTEGEEESVFVLFTGTVPWYCSLVLFTEG